MPVMELRSQQAAGDAGSERMKLLLAVIDRSSASSATIPPPSSLSSSTSLRTGAGTPPRKVASPSSPTRSVTPTQEARPPPIMPLSRAPMLPNPAMVHAMNQHKRQVKGLMMPPPLPKVTVAGKMTYAVNAVNYNDMPKVITVKKLQESTSKPQNRFSAPLTLKSCFSNYNSTKAPLPSQLHSLCCWGKGHSDLEAIVVDILTRDPMAARRKCQVTRSPVQIKRASLSPFRHARQRHEPYQFALNLALFHQSQEQPNLRLLELLVGAAPEVIRMEDGPSGGGSLTVALRHHPRNLEIVQLLLRTSPMCIRTKDRRGNTPLHVACFQGSSLEVIEAIYQQDPSAIDKTNIAGETPWQIIQRNSLLSSSPVAEFLFACAKRREGRIRKS